ncbi:MAG TPA: tRNA dihydrouridine synthase DusB [Mycobacteriales bacterium]|nr:tRNA dihydrouridine synthase DusB [Mycobacteriales bacterium]
MRIGPHEVWPPVVLAPMAGVTDSPFRRVCRTYGAGLYVSEMITARAVMERHETTMAMVRFAPEETPRSLQLYAVDPVVVGEAVRILVGEDRVDHVDLNFGCPVPKVTRRGGGSALPWKRGLFAAIVRSAVRQAGPVPVTVKMRLGIDDEHLTYLDAGRIAEAEGAVAVALHGRTAAQHYSGTANWAPIGELVEALSVPVLGNGDLWTASDALRMVRETGCAGVVVGRGCMGRPWLFGELAAAFDGRPEPTPPGLGEIAALMRRHAALLAAWKGESHGVRDFRKHAGWYLKGFEVGGELRRQFGQIDSLTTLDDLIALLPLDQPYPDGIAAAPRGRTTGAPRRVVLPDGWLNDREYSGIPDDAELLAVSGG